MLTFTPTSNLEWSTNLHLFRLLEEAGELWENLCRHTENTQTSHFVIQENLRLIFLVSDALHRVCYFLSTLSLLSFIPGLQGGVGRSDPGAAEEGEQPLRPARPQTDRRLLHGQLSGWFQHLLPQWVHTVLHPATRGNRALTFSRNAPPSPRAPPLWSALKNKSITIWKEKICKHEICALKGTNTQRQPNPRLRKSRAFFPKFWSFVSSIQESICEICFQSQGWNAQLMLKYMSEAIE